LVSESRGIFCGFFSVTSHAAELRHRRVSTAAACLPAEDVDWSSRTISYSRAKLKSRVGIKPALIRFGAEIEVILKRRPASGPLFPYLRTVRANDRATEFRQRCDGLGISGVSLHSYRYAWAERALKCGYPRARLTCAMWQGFTTRPCRFLTNAWISG
jgi:hypothetical protein